MRISGIVLSAAATIDGSINSRLLEALIVEADRIAGDHAGTSSMTKSLFKALRYEHKVFSLIVPKFVFISLLGGNYRKSVIISVYLLPKLVHMVTDTCIPLFFCMAELYLILSEESECETYLLKLPLKMGSIKK